MQRLIVRLIDSQNPEALQAALRWLYSFVRPHRLAIAGLLGLSVCASALVLVQPWLTKLLIDDGLLARNFSMLVLIAAGLLAHVVWRLVQAALDPEHPGNDAKRVPMRAFYALSAAVYASMAYTAWQLARVGRADGGDGTEVWVARLLSKPFGTWLVMAAGLGVIGYGIHQLVKAARGDVNKHMDVAHVGSHAAAPPRALTAIGRIGTAARGLVLLPLGWFVFNAGRLYRASAAADTGEVLRMLDHGGLLAAVGLGLVAYGVHQIAKAVYRRIERPA